MEEGPEVLHQKQKQSIGELVCKKRSDGGVEGSEVTVKRTVTSDPPGSMQANKLQLQH